MEIFPFQTLADTQVRIVVNRVLAVRLTVFSPADLSPYCYRGNSEPFRFELRLELCLSRSLVEVVYFASERSSVTNRSQPIPVQVHSTFGKPFRKRYHFKVAISRSLQ